MKKEDKVLGNRLSKWCQGTHTEYHKRKYRLRMCANMGTYKNPNKGI